jgi:hypothetical protein
LVFLSVGFAGGDFRLSNFLGLFSLLLLTGLFGRAEKQSLLVLVSQLYLNITTY